jgi:bifunctional ADP-heptose synthase (sugar kinase/adenylyltransferase)
MICGLKCVDYVIALKEPNCIDMIRLLKPQYYFKTSDDRSQEIVRKEMELVELYGGSINICPTTEHNKKSTTTIIHSVLKKLMQEN